MRVASLSSALLLLFQTPTAVHGACVDAGNCGSCLGESSDCTWFQDIGFCETGCGMDGCGATICASELSTCEECLGGPGTSASGQYAWVPETQECINSCDDAPADASCFKGKSSVDPSGYDPSMCAEIAPPSKCKTMTTCTDCLVDGVCAWSEGECFDSCADMDVPADAACFEGGSYTPAEACPDYVAPSKCEGFGTDCRKCLNKECSWSEGACYDSCMDAMADAACFPGADYGREICPPTSMSTEDASPAAPGKHVTGTPLAALVLAAIPLFYY